MKKLVCLFLALILTVPLVLSAAARELTDAEKTLLKSFQTGSQIDGNYWTIPSSLNQWVVDFVTGLPEALTEDQIETITKDINDVRARVKSAGSGDVDEWNLYTKGRIFLDVNEIATTVGLRADLAEDGETVCIVDPENSKEPLCTFTEMVRSAPPEVLASLTYQILNGEMQITGYTGTEASFTVPDIIDGIPVTSIGENAFSGAASLTAVVLPEGIETIEKGAFSGCGALETVTIPKSVTSIGAGAFSDCVSLKSVQYSGTEKQWEKIQNEDRSEAFLNASVSFPPPVKGDVNGDAEVNDADAIYLLMHTFFPEMYPVDNESACDFNGDGEVNDADAIYLLMYTFFPEMYPI